jgi:hypothetical protein
MDAAGTRQSPLDSPTLRAYACNKKETREKHVSSHDDAALVVLLGRPVKGLALHAELVALFDQVVELLAPGKYLLDRVVQHLFSRCTFHGQ